MLPGHDRPSLFRDEEPVRIHPTFLDPDGRANRRPPPRPVATPACTRPATSQMIIPDEPDLEAATTSGESRSTPCNADGYPGTDALRPAAAPRTAQAPRGGRA